MRQLFRRGVVTIAAGVIGAAIVWSSAMAQGEPPARVARLAFTNGTVSFHDDEQSGWTPAVINTPLTSGDSLWTEPNARSEISLAGTRIRMEGATQLDMLALDDTQTRLQLAQGRIDVKPRAMDANQPYEIVTPRGTVKLLQQGDYYVEAGSTEDPTRLGVRSGAAQIQALDGQVLAVRANEVAEVMGDGTSPQLRTIKTAPPAAPAHWASRDRQIVYDPPQYLSAGVTGYEDLNAYGDWINDGGYGRVWVPRSVPSGWAPYRTGHWAYVQPWGWTWIDEQPWGFAPYHYGRWANRGNRWVWVPPQRDVRPVYAPALVAFVGGTELAVTLGNQSAAPGLRAVLHSRSRILPAPQPLGPRRGPHPRGSLAAGATARGARGQPRAGDDQSALRHCCADISLRALAAGDALGPPGAAAGDRRRSRRACRRTARADSVHRECNSGSIRYNTAAQGDDGAGTATPGRTHRFQRAGRQDGDRRHADPRQAGRDGEVGRARAKTRRDPAHGGHRRQGETGRADARASAGCGAAGTEGCYHACTCTARQTGRASEAAAGRTSTASSTTDPRASASGQACRSHQATGDASARTSAGQAR
jgi:hypothetical protein